MNKLNDNVKMFVKICFKIKETKELKYNKKEKYKNTYFSFFQKRGVPEDKPEFKSYVIFFVFLLSIGVIPIIFTNLLFFAIYLISFAIIITLLIIDNQKNNQKWEKVNNEYLMLVEKNDKEMEAELLPKLKRLLDLLKDFYPATILTYNNICSGDIKDETSAIAFLYNNKHETNSNDDYIFCEYCKTFVHSENNHCPNCGAGIKI